MSPDSNRSLLVIESVGGIRLPEVRRFFASIRIAAFPE
jgi:hypothetical protein